MASDIFIKIDGIPGESRNKDHKDWIDIQSWSWGMSQQGSMSSGGGGGRGKVSVQDLHFTKEVDKSSPKLMEACCNGKHIPSIILSANKAGEKPVEFFKITLGDCLVSSVNSSGSGGGYTESVTINFAKFDVDYKEQDDKGGVKGSVAIKFNVKENA